MDNFFFFTQYPFVFLKVILASNMIKLLPYVLVSYKHIKILNIPGGGSAQMSCHTCAGLKKIEM